MMTEMAAPLSSKKKGESREAHSFEEQAAFQKLVDNQIIMMKAVCTPFLPRKLEDSDH